MAVDGTAVCGVRKKVHPESMHGVCGIYLLHTGDQIPLISQIEFAIPRDCIPVCVNPVAHRSIGSC